MRSNCASCSTVNRYRSSGVLTKPTSTNCSINLSPKPSIFTALREAKCIRLCLSCAGQIKPPVQRATASPASRTIGEAHSGHCVGMMKTRASSGRFSMILMTTSGITSPARRTTTVSPMRTSLRATSSALCNVALVTTTPPTSTGSSRATGVIAPVRPTCTVMSCTTVVISCAGNLWAIAQRGERDTKPSASCCALSLTLYTTPSMSNGSSLRRAPVCA